MSGENPNPEGVENPSRQSDEYPRIAGRRRLLGYLLGLAAIVGFVALIIFVGRGLGNLFSESTLKNFQALCADEQKCSLAARIFSASLAGHIAFSAGCAWFLYQLLRAGERLSLPYWWVDKAGEHDNTVLNAMMGVKTPASEVRAAVSLAKELIASPKPRAP